jgi:hypothetical protein
MYKPLLYLINVLHILIVLFIVVTPFLNTNWYLLCHVIIVPFIMLHWATNNNTCALTIAEYYLREIITGKPVERQQCFMSRLIDPVYDFNKNNKDISIFLYIFSTALFGLSLSKLIMKRRSGEIKTWWDLFKY